MHFHIKKGNSAVEKLTPDLSESGTTNVQRATECFLLHTTVTQKEIISSIINGAVYMA